MQEIIRVETYKREAKSGLVGPGETIPIIHGYLGLSTWQKIFLCEFEGPGKAGRLSLLL